MSGLKDRPSGKAILQNKASQHPVRPTRPDGRDAHFVVADGVVPEVSAEVGVSAIIVTFGRFNSEH